MKMQNTTGLPARLLDVKRKYTNHNNGRIIVVTSSLLIDAQLTYHVS